MAADEVNWVRDEGEIKPAGLDEDAVLNIPGGAKLSNISPDSDPDAHHGKTTTAADLSDVSADSVPDAHHLKTLLSVVSQARWTTEGNVSFTDTAADQVGLYMASYSNSGAGSPAITVIMVGGESDFIQQVTAHDSDDVFATTIAFAMPGTTVELGATFGTFEVAKELIFEVS